MFSYYLHLWKSPSTNIFHNDKPQSLFIGYQSKIIFSINSFYCSSPEKWGQNFEKEEKKKYLYFAKFRLYFFAPNFKTKSVANS